MFQEVYMFYGFVYVFSIKVRIQRDFILIKLIYDIGKKQSWVYGEKLKGDKCGFNDL